MNRYAVTELDFAVAAQVAERYFDVDLETWHDAYDVLVDNGIRPEVAEAFAKQVFPEEGKEN